MNNEDFTLTPIRELKEYKKLLDERIAEQRVRWANEKKILKAFVKGESAKDYPRADRIASQENKVIRAVDRLNGLVEARELFTVVKQQHNQKIKEIKENGILVREIQDMESVLKQKKERAKEKNIVIPRKKKEKKD